MDAAAISKIAAAFLFSPSASLFYKNKSSAYGNNKGKGGKG
jgi:hypothetical protein